MNWGGFDVSYLLGPNGGLFGLGVLVGSIAGWGFAAKTILKLTAKERDDCEREKGLLQAELRECRERELRGMERQLGQARDSTAYLIDRGRIKPVDDIS